MRFGPCFAAFSLMGVLLASCVAPPKQSMTIEWDPASLTLLSAKGDPAWNGYPRLIELADHSLFLVYFNSAKGIMGRRSADAGKTWDAPALILPNSATHAMDNPEIVQLKNGALLVSTNLRPFGGDKNRDPSRRFQIGVIKSDDNGAHWSALKILYSASWSFKDGCWEPKALQLPSGEVQLYFSDESPYTQSDEQNISLLSSMDDGATWTAEPKIVSFRKGFRDGMATPIVLKGQATLVMPIEDNGWLAPLPSPFKISLIRQALADGWPAPIAGDGPQREYALAGVLPKIGPYAGAPYITQLPAGQTVLSFQSTLARKATSGAELDYAIQYVLMGDAQGQHFQNLSVPFPIPEGKHGLWNSVAALSNGEIVALTSTNGLTRGRDEVWMIKGRLK